MFISPRFSLFLRPIFTLSAPSTYTWNYAPVRALRSVTRFTNVQSNRHITLIFVNILNLTFETAERDAQ